MSELKGSAGALANAAVRARGLRRRERRRKKKPSTGAARTFSFIGGRKQRRGPLTCAKSITAVENRWKWKQNFCACLCVLLDFRGRAKQEADALTASLEPLRWAALRVSPSYAWDGHVAAPSLPITAATCILLVDVVLFGLQPSSSKSLLISSCLMSDWCRCCIYADVCGPE